MDRIETNDQATGDAASAGGQGGRLGLLGSSALTSTTPPTALADPSTGMMIEDYIPDPVGRQLRVDLVTPHMTHAEGSWMGFSAQPGFQVVAVANAQALMSAIAAAAGQSRIIECDWDGISETTAGANGRQASALVANAAVDWGYNRSATNILVRPRTGRTPRIRATSGQSAAGASDGMLYLTGVSRIEFRDLVFDGCGISIARNSTYPELPMAVIKRCLFLNAKNGRLGALFGNGIRLLHVEDCLFDGCGMGILHSAHFLRSFNNGFVRHFNQDIHAARSYTQGFQKDWHANIWISGSVVWALNNQSSAHLDFAQISTAQVEVHKGYKHLVEFCVVYADNGTNTSTQGVYGSDGAAQRYRCDHLVHNNVFAIGASWAVAAYDPSDNGTKVVTRNLVARVGFGFGYSDGGGAPYDAYARIVGARGGQPSGTGRMIVSENYFAHNGDDCGRAKDDDNRWDNVNLDPRSGAAPGTRPETLLTGNGTWTKNASGRTTYADPAPGTLSKAAAKAALLSFFQPKAGWQAAGAGPVDPITWPTNPAIVPLRINASAPDRILASQWSVADAGTGGTATVTVTSVDPMVTGLGVAVDGAAPIPLAAPLVGTHKVTGLTNFAHSFALVTSNADGASGPSVPKMRITTKGNGILDFAATKPSLSGSGTCSALAGGWQWSNSGTGTRALYWGVIGLMIPGDSYQFEMEVEANSLVDVISVRGAINTGLTSVRGIGASIPLSVAGVKQTFAFKVYGGTDTNYLGFYMSATGARTVKLTGLRLMPL